MLAAATTAAAEAGTPHARGHQASLRAAVARLGTREESTLLTLYALDSRIQATRATLGALGAQQARIRAELRLVKQRLAATRASISAAESALGESLRSLYKDGDVDGLAVVLGAESLDDAVSTLDDLQALSARDDEVVQSLHDAERRLGTLQTQLQSGRDRLAESTASLAQQTAALGTARSVRLAYLARLRTRSLLAGAEIRALDRRARVAVHRSARIAPPPATPAEPAAAPTGGRTITVTSTGYVLRGNTSSGLPTGRGIVAVDPRVIPLGTHLTVPGYGGATAADTGPGIRGDTIDLWFPTLAQARAWGRRTITITVD
jgi:3D (Asp-Asp-Asp) domain-containing protein/septal ring factor EnvC (AmiA/AmiB activator)